MKKSKKVQRRIIQKLLPVVVAIVLIIIIIIFSLSTGLIQKYSYSSEQADLYDYLGLTSENEVAMILDNDYSDSKAIIQDGLYYIDYSLVTNLFNSNFYFDENENLLLYSTGTETIRADESGKDFINYNDSVYISLDYVKKYTNLEYKTYTDPNRMEIKYQWGTVNKATVSKDTELRVLGGIKSAVITKILKGDTVEIIEPMEDWSEIKTSDGYLGYVENKKLNNYREEQETPVTEVEELSIKSQTKDYKICLGWHQVTGEAANETLIDIVANTKGLNVISPTWFSLSDNEGNFTSISSASYVEQAHGMGLEVWGLVDNFSAEVNSYDVLSYTSKRQNLISQLINKSVELGLDGINVDFENLTTETGTHFAQFIRELSIECRKQGIVLSVDNYVPKEYTAHYYRDVQGKFADYVIIMGYDEHYAGSEESGSVASVDFVREGIEKTMEEVPANKVINGIPFYTRVWTETPKTQEDIQAEGDALSGNLVNVTSEAVGMSAAESMLEQNGVAATWDDATAQNYGEFEKDGSIIKVWLEDEASIDVKMQLMQKNHLAGVACWKLGFEKASVWDVIQKYLQ